MINTTSERLKARNFLICRYFSFYEQLKFRAQLTVWSMMESHSSQNDTFLEGKAFQFFWKEKPSNLKILLCMDFPSNLIFH